MASNKSSTLTGKLPGPLYYKIETGEMTDISRIKVFSTQAHKCSYLDEQEAKTVFVDPEMEVSTTLYSNLCDIGFRRSGDHFYRPQCDNCQACISLRLSVNQFKPNRNQRRTIKKNQDITVKRVDDIASQKHFELYSEYITLQHADGDMYPPDWLEYQSFLCKKHETTEYFEFYLGDKLVGVSVCDKLIQGLSAIYTFYSPHYPERSLGKFAILWQIELTQQRNLPFLYLGYWIKECQKMSYKLDYRPCELLIGGKWLTAT